jgi:hypothetical protein
MITLLTNELNRINKGCGCSLRIFEDEMFNCNFKELCKTCQKEKETLKKVSLMWIDSELKWLNEMREAVMNSDKVSGVFPFTDLGTKMVEMEKIKSLMEKENAN